VPVMFSTGTWIVRLLWGDKRHSRMHLWWGV